MNNLCFFIGLFWVESGEEYGRTWNVISAYESH